jgi:DNA-binding LacI/PurR family transcriptional regulator
LTTIRQNKTALGRTAGESLVRLIEDEDAKPPKIALPVELVERQSAGPRR